MEQIVRGVAAILEYEGVRRVHLIGISLGGMQAQCFVRAYPHLAQSLLLCQTGAPDPLFAALLGTAGRLLPLLPPRLLRAVGKQAILHAFAGNDPERRFWHAYLDDLFTFPVGRAKERMVSACRKISDFGAHYVFTPNDLAQWPGRILIITSEEDHWIPAALQHRQRLLYPQAQVAHLNAGHILGANGQAQYLTVVERFLAETPAPLGPVGRGGVQLTAGSTGCCSSLELTGDSDASAYPTPTLVRM